MASSTVITLEGKLKITTNRRELPITLMQMISGLESKSLELTIPHNGVAPTAVALGFSPGVAEALFLHVYTPKTLQMFLTPTGGAEERFDVKGHQFLTFSPGRGLAALRFQNTDDTNDVTVEVTVGALATADDPTPGFWA